MKHEDVMKNAKVTTAEIAAVTHVTESWDDVTRWLAMMDFVKVRDIMERTIAEGTSTREALGERGVAATQRKILETYELERVAQVLQALGCPCANCSANAANAPASGKLTVASDPANLVSSARSEPGPGHDVVTVFNRGANAGTLTVRKGDGDTLARRLVGDLEYVLEEHEPLAQMRDLIVKLGTQAIDSEALVAIEADSAKLAHEAGWIR